jgi:hypothetical protein
MRRQSSVRFLSFGLILVVGLGPSQMVGQAVSSIPGAVVDPVGSAVAQVKVTATRADTGISESKDTNGAGIVTFANLEVGTYNVAVTATGFGTKAISGVTVDVSQQRGLNFTLAVAGSTETAVVSATEPLMNTFSTLGTSNLTENNERQIRLAARLMFWGKTHCGSEQLESG